MPPPITFLVGDVAIAVAEFSAPFLRRMGNWRVSARVPWGSFSPPDPMALRWVEDEFEHRNGFPLLLVMPPAGLLSIATEVLNRWPDSRLLMSGHKIPHPYADRKLQKSLTPAEIDVAADLYSSFVNSCRELRQLFRGHGQLFDYDPLEYEERPLEERIATFAAALDYLAAIS